MLKNKTEKLPTLPNGATLLAEDGDVVLAKWERGEGRIEFITWIVDKDMNCYHGNYFTNIGSATNDFLARARQCK
jgi:hypothetical protein